MCAGVHRGAVAWTLPTPELCNPDFGPIKQGVAFTDGPVPRCFCSRCILYTMPHVWPLTLCPAAHLVDCASNEEAVIKCVQLLTLWQLVTGTHQAQQRYRQALVAVVKETLVQQRQQGVQDGTAGDISSGKGIGWCRWMEGSASVSKLGSWLGVHTENTVASGALRKLHGSNEGRRCQQLCGHHTCSSMWRPCCAAAAAPQTRPP